MSVVSALMPCFLLQSTWSDVRSYSFGGASVPRFFCTSVTVNGFPSIVAKACSPSSLLVNFPFVAVNVVSRYIVASTQYGSGSKLSISFCLFTISASVGVCTLPMESTCLFCPYFNV